MDNYFSIANSILTGSLRPWTTENQDEDKFRNFLNHNLRQCNDNPPLFCQTALTAFKAANFTIEFNNLEELKELSLLEITEPLKLGFPQFFNKKTEFYSLLISNSFNCIIAGIFKSIKSSDEIDATYKLYQQINKLESLISIITNEEHSDKATLFILDTLSLFLFATHSILTEKFKSYIDFDILSQNEVLYQLCPGYESEKDDKSKLAYFIENYISTQSKESVSLSTSQTLTQTIIVKPQETQKRRFAPISDDNRPLKKGVASFHDIIRNPQRFALFEEKLFLNDYISDQYAFCGKQGYRNQLAIIYHLLIEKNYFNKFNDTLKKKISSREIVKFLNHRYDVDVDKQFRSYQNKPSERVSFIESANWLYQLPTC